MRLHTKISLTKSAIRIIGCLGAIVVSALRGVDYGLVVLAIAFFLAELLGVAEEIDDGGNAETK